MIFSDKSSFQNLLTISMLSETNNQSTRLLQNGEQVPYDLLLLADEFIEVIDRYIDGEIFVFEQDEQIIGVYILYPLDDLQIEIKNIAVKQEYENRGIGKFLLKDAERRAKENGYHKLLIGTPTIAAKQLSIYYKAGFKPYYIKKDFFITNYPEPMFEDGVLLTDMAVLKKDLI